MIAIHFLLLLPSREPRKISREYSFQQGKQEPRFSFNPGLALKAFSTTGSSFFGGVAV